MLLRKRIHNKFRLVIALSDQEYSKFLNNFKGCLIFRGKASSSYKNVDHILWRIKRRFKKDPLVKFRDIANNLLPLFASSQKRLGKRFQAVPSIAFGNRRFVIMNNWIIREQKGATNTRGADIDDVARNLLEVGKKKGKLMALKKEFYKTALSGRHFLWRRKGLKVKRAQRKAVRKKIFKVARYVDHVKLR